MTSEVKELVERLRHLVGQIDPCMVGGEDARLLTQAADTLQSQERRIGELECQMRMIVSHATGGASQDIDAGVNDICVRITAMRNHVYQAGKDQADKEAGRTLTTGGGHDGHD